MFSGHQGSKWRDTTLSMLDRVVQGLNVAKDVCGIPPAEIALGVACVLLTTIKVQLRFPCDNELSIHAYSGHNVQQRRFHQAWTVLR